MVLFVVALFNYIDRSLLSILQVPLKAELGLSDAQLGALTGLAFALVYATAALPLARLVDRGRRLWIMAAALATWSAMTALTGLAIGFASLVLLRIGVALGESVSVPATHSLLSDYFGLRRRGTAFAVWAFASPIGIMLGVFSGGWLSDALGWRTSFAVIGAAGLLLVPLLLLLPEPVRGQSEPADAARTTDAPPPFRDAVRILWTLPAFRLLVIATSLQGFAYTAMLNWTPPFYARVHQMLLTDVALAAALMIGIGGGAGALAGGMVVDRLARRDVRWYGWGPGGAILLSVPFGLGQFLAPTADVSIALGFVTVFLAGCYIAPVNATAQSMVLPTMRAFTSASLLFVATVIGTGLGPLLTGVASDILIERFGLADTSLRYALSLTLIASLASSVLMLRMAARLPYDLRGASVSGR